MASTESPPLPVLGEQGEPCGACGAPLAEDQRYCLNCGQRRSGHRVDYESLLGGASNGSAASEAPSSAPRRSGLAESPLAAVLGIAALGLMLLLGVLIGKGNSGGSSSPAPVVQVGGGSAADTASTTGGGGTSQDVADTGTFNSDWPSGKSGYTVELGTLPKAGTSAADVEAQKKQAEDKGAPDVGALDSDKYASLPGGKYVIYSGVYGSKAEADKALLKLKKSFPTATVVRVSTSAGGGSGSAGSRPTTNSVNDLTSQAARNAKQPVQASDKALNGLNSKSGQAYENAIKKLPDQISTQGKKQPLNPNKQTGGGTGTITIGG